MNLLAEYNDLCGCISLFLFSDAILEFKNIGINIGIRIITDNGINLGISIGEN